VGYVSVAYNDTIGAEDVERDDLGVIVHSQAVHRQANLKSLWAAKVLLLLQSCNGVSTEDTSSRVELRQDVVAQHLVDQVFGKVFRNVLGECKVNWRKHSKVV